MRICFVDFDMTVIGGAEQVCASLANEFCKRHEVYIYSLNAVNEVIPYTFDERICFHRGTNKEERLRIQIQRNFMPFIKFVKENKIDIVLLVGNYPALIVSLTRFFTKAKYVYCDHGALINQWKQKDITLIRFVDAFLAHKIVTLTERTKEDYHQKFHIPYKKLECIYNWVEMPEENVKYETESKKILSVGRFGKEKGYDLLVEVAEKVKTKHEDWSWDIYGDGETFTKIQRMIQQKNLEGFVHLKGNALNMKELYPNYAFLVLTSYREGLPLVLLEAKANKLPVISFDILTGPREIINDQEDGFLVEPYDTDMMADKIHTLIENAELRQAFSKNTEKNIEKFSKDRITKEWELLFEIIK